MSENKNTADEKAIFSLNMNYRYTLYRRTGPSDSRVLFIMLNPSTADDKQNDPTVRRCIGYAQGWGYGLLTVCNIFALRSTDPKALYASDDPIGSENNNHIITEAKKADLILCAWGNHGSHYGRGNEVIRMLNDYRLHPRCLKLSKQNQPVHPLYQKKDLLPTMMPPPDEWGIDRSCD